jgi:catechol 2,3-dioxygenase-like lactoylglutathione lyase family enzyme
LREVDDMSAIVVDRVVIAVPDLALAREEYQQIYGVRPVQISDHSAWLALTNAVIELRELETEQARIWGLVFTGGEPEEAEEVLANSMKLQLYQCDGQASRQFRAAHGQIPASEFTIDHIVLRTANADDCVSLFGHTLGIRLALDKTVPEWGGRMLFFRTGGLTLEVIEAAENKPKKDFFWGIALQNPNLERVSAELGRRGVAVSALREGRKAGTRVATLGSHTLGIPTLLIQPAGVK